MKKILLTLLIAITTVISYSQTPINGMTGEYITMTNGDIVFLYPYTSNNIKLLENNLIELKNKNYIFKNGYNKLDSNNCKTGIWVEYYSNGQIEVKCSYKNGLKNGLCECYYETGELWEVGYFVDNKLEGISITYYKNKEIKYLDLYKNGVEIKSLK